MKRTVKFDNGNFFVAVPEMNSFLKEKAKKFIREDVGDDVELCGLILPFLTETNLQRNSGAWFFCEFHDFAEKPTTQKLSVFGIREGRFFSLDIPGQGIHIIAYDGHEVTLEKKNSFSEKKFLEKSEKIILEKEKIREASRAAECEAKKKAREAAAAAKREEEKVLQRASIKPVKVNLFEEDNFFGADEKCPISDITKKAVNK